MKETYSGVIELSFKKQKDRTIADRTYRRGNSRISANIPIAGETPCYFLISTGGGFVEGENYLQTIHLGPDTHAILTTQTPNYIYKCVHGNTTRQKMVLSAEDRSILEFYIDETIPYQNAIYQQDTEIELGQGTRLILTDGLSSGWSPDGAPFTYGRIGQHIRIKKNGKLLYNDYLLVDPRTENMEELGFFEGMSCFHSAAILDDSIDKGMISSMRAVLDALDTPARYGISLLEEGGAALRILGPDPDANHKVMWTWISFYREQILGFPHINLRKSGRAEGY
ncbi:MAG: urease accessory protein UreD [Eubacterium sp.]|nr:urease accessory protein UreD [Eubacterium sp.]